MSRAYFVNYSPLSLVTHWLSFFLFPFFDWETLRCVDEAADMVGGGATQEPIVLVVDFHHAR